MLKHQGCKIIPALQLHPQAYNKSKTIIILVTLMGLFLLPDKGLLACGGKDIVFSEDPAGKASKTLPQNDKFAYFDDRGTLIKHKSEAKISPALAQAIAEKFLRENFPEPPLPLTFRKLERVHRKLVYQFHSEPVSDYNGKYHLGPVNFIVDRLVLDIDAVTGNLYIANGCGSAPGKLLYQYNPTDFKDMDFPIQPALISNNTNFIARRTGNPVTIDGKIRPEEWKDTGHKYFYLGDYKPHADSDRHETPYYYAEVRTQIDDKNIYFAVKTDTPFWIALMFKNNPNLGMLGAYRDAKVMKSDGEISDRFFTRRKDRTLYLEKDENDNILAKAGKHEDFYTYEFAFPLRTDDPKDVSFEEGKAYNMLLLVGNTLEHYGIFTLDDAHANHDHSQNNKEHVDVWASNEETFRIGTPADRDIFGNQVKAVFENYVSGFDPSKKLNYVHHRKTSKKDSDKHAH